MAKPTYGFFFTARLNKIGVSRQDMPEIHRRMLALGWPFQDGSFPRAHKGRWRGTQIRNLAKELVAERLAHASTAEPAQPEAVRVDAVPAPSPSELPPQSIRITIDLPLGHEALGELLASIAKLGQPKQASVAR